ncbi:MAG: hypothetical protein ACRD3F_05875 [Acidobacteriaceae bacterium]
MTGNPELSFAGYNTAPTTRWDNRMAHASIFIVLASLCFFAAPSWGQTGSTQGNTAADSVSAHNFTAHRNSPHIRSSADSSGKRRPLGVAPPSGQDWHVQANDNFDQDNSINQALWNGGTGGGMPSGFCRTPATSCGYTGDDCKSYFGTYPRPPFATIVPGNGLVIQATHAAPGDLKYHDNKMADIQSYGKITIHPGSFVEWQAKLPTDRHGEGDGWHIDLWCTTLVRHQCSDSSEVDVAEKVLSVADSSKAHYVVHDQPQGLHTVIQTTYSAAGSPDLSAGFHTYGLFWRNDHLGKQGSLEAYIDGKPIVDHPVPINDPSWSSGAYCYAGWMQQELEVWGGGVSISSHTSSKDPVYIKRFTVWKAY